MEKELFEKKNVTRAALKLALPCVAGQMILVLYNMADTFFIGLGGDDAKITALTISMPAFMLLSAISNLFGIGGASAISRALGSEEKGRTSSISSYSFWGCLISSAAYSLLTLLLVDTIADMLGAADMRVHSYTVEYLVICVTIGGTATSLSALLSHLLRAMGRSFASSFGIMLGGVMNMLLDPLFMFVLMPEGKEVLGAAIATALSNLLSLAFFASILLRDRNHGLSFSLGERRNFRNIRRDVLESGLPAFMMTLCENVSYAMLDKIISGYGIEAQAGIGVAKKINMMAHSIVRGMAQGILPLIGYSYGSGDMKRMKKALSCSAAFSVGSAAACLMLFQLFPAELNGIFLNGTSDSLSYGIGFLRILSLGAPFSAFAYVSISFFQATGEGRKSLLLALLRKGLLDIPLMLMLSAPLGCWGAAIATPLADAVCAMIATMMVLGFMHCAESGKNRRSYGLMAGRVYNSTGTAV